MNIIHITGKKEWSEAGRLGRYVAPSLASQGFIHCSTAKQTVPVAEKYYPGQGGLVLLVIDPARLTSQVKWEPPDGGAPPPGVPLGDPFPHIYGPLNLEAVVQVLDFEPDAQGHFSLPSTLAASS